MTHSTAKKATSRNIEPTIQCRVQKHAPAARKMTVATIRNCSPTQHCMRNWMEAIL